jgi:hypothetical protein
MRTLTYREHGEYSKADDRQEYKSLSTDYKETESVVFAASISNRPKQLRNIKNQLTHIRPF